MTERVELGRRELLVALLGTLGVGSYAALGDDGGNERENDVSIRVFAGERRDSLPVPRRFPAVGITDEGVYWCPVSDDEWRPFDWAEAFHTDRPGRVALGSRERPLASIRSERVNGVPQVRELVSSGSGTKAEPYAVPSDVLDGHYGLLHFGNGWYETDGLATDATVEYDEEAVYLQGEGARSTTLLHSDTAPETPTVHFRGAGGNFGGLRDVSVYGGGEGQKRGSANIVETDGGVIDYQFENVLIRWGGGDALKINISGSGTRVTNAWLENVSGWAFNLAGGGRMKLDNVHVTGTAGGIYTNGTRGAFTNVTLTHLNGGNAVVSESAGNQFANVYVYGDVRRGFEIRGNRNLITNTYVGSVDGAAFFLAAPCTVTNVIAEDFGENARTPMLDVFSDNIHVQNALARGGSAGRRLFTIRPDVHHCYLDGVAGVAGVDWTCVIGRGATENVVDNLLGVEYAAIDDRGTRTLVNRWGTNAGDPNATGEWKGHADYAGLMGATIWDTTTTPWTGYGATPDGEWVETGSAPTQ